MTRCVEASALHAANAALDRATDEVLTNMGADTGRYLRLCASIESHEDFNDFPADAPAQTTGAMAADALSLPHEGIGNGAPLTFHRGASSDDHNNQSRGIER